MRCTCSRTSKDLNSSFFLPFIETKLPQNLDKNINSLLISTKQFLQKNSSLKMPQKISQKISEILKVSIQFHPSHLEAENPFGLVYSTNLFDAELFDKFVSRSTDL